MVRVLATPAVPRVISGELLVSATGVALVSVKRPDAVIVVAPLIAPALVMLPELLFSPPVIEAPPPETVSVPAEVIVPVPVVAILPEVESVPSSVMVNFDTPPD